MGRIRFTPDARQSSIAHGDVTFTFDRNVTAGHFVDGPAWIVVPSGSVMLDEPTPAQTLYSGSIANGCMVNPVVGQQGYDQRMMGFSAGLVASSWPRAVQAGDVIVKAVSRPVLNGPVNQESRGGTCDSYGALFVLQGPPPPGSFAPAGVGWSGRGAPRPIVLKTSIDDFVASLPIFNMASVPAKPPYDKIMEMFDKWCPAGQRLDLMYEPLFPWGMGFTPTPNNYGRDSGATFQTAALSLLRSDFTTDQKIAIARRLVSWGIQFSDPSIGSGTRYPADGGHFVFHQSAALLYLYLTEQTSRIANFLTEQGGNFNQAFYVTAQNVAEDFVRHANPFKPCAYRERLVIAASGTSLTFQATRGPGVDGDTPNFSVRNLVVKRVSDGASAYVTAVGSVAVPAGPPTNLTVTIDAAPTPPFAPGDVIWFEPPPGAEPKIGDADWRLIPNISSYNPSWNATYRELNFWSGHVMFLEVLGLIEAAGLQVVRDWVIRANKPNTPLSTFDYRPHHKAFVDRNLKGYDLARDLWNAYWSSIYFNPLADIFYSEAVTSEDLVDENGNLERAVSAPAHLAGHDAGGGVDGVYSIRKADVLAGPVVLYPGELAMSVAYSGGTLSLVHPPWVAAVGPIDIDYRVMVGETEVATALPYATVQTAGTVVRVLADVRAGDVTTTIEVGRVTIAENPLGPQLTGFAINYATNEISFASDIAATMTWRRYPPGHVFQNEPQEVLDGTGAIGGGSFAVVAGPNTASLNSTGGISGLQLLRFVARVGTGPLSNVLGEQVDIAPPVSALTAPNYRASTIGGNGASAGVASVSIPLPAYNLGDLVQLPIGIDCRASFIAGITAVGPNGEVATVKQGLVDNEEGGNSAAAIALLYFRATAANVAGSVTINLTPGGFKSVEQIICTPIIRYDVKDTGDPYAQVLRTFSTTAVANAQTAAITAINAASRIEAAFVNNVTLPPGTAPEGWFLRERGLIGPQAMQLFSRNEAVTEAGQVIAPVSVPLGATAQPWVGLTWELLPKGA